MGTYIRKKNASSRSLQSLERSVNNLETSCTYTSKFTMKKKKSMQKRCRKRLSQLLHTHVILISVCILSTLDASCVLGQIICDILIMSDAQHENDVIQDKTTDHFIALCPALNHHAEPDHDLHLDDILEILEGNSSICSSDTQNGLYNENDSEIKQAGYGFESVRYFIGVKPVKSGDENHQTDVATPKKQKRSDQPRHRSKRAAGGGDHDHGHSLTHEITHYFHIGSMAILSILLFEAMLKIFAMGGKFLHHKLEVFDAFVVTVSWCLDVAFWEGIWAHPGTEAATILIIILPWRIIRIVNSFVLVIKEKDLVQLKIVKQQYRRAMKGAKALKRKLDLYRVESRQLQGLCRKHKIDESEIIACAPIIKQRRRSSVFPVLSSFASLAMIGAVGNSVPDLHDPSSSEDEENDDKSIRDSSMTKLFRSVSSESDISTAVTFSLSPDPMDTPTNDKPVFSFDIPYYDQVKTKDISQPQNEVLSKPSE